MRRPHRSIEVFDISLMAVVTKAMGAFLVLMLIFMQYYSSGPIGPKTTADIAQTIAATEKQIDEAARKLAQNSNPADIARLLAEAKRLLEEARKQIAQLQRENDALNAQVARLEQEKARLEKQIEELQRKIDAEKTIISGNLISWDCPDVRLELALISTNMYVERDQGKTKDKYVLNFGGLGYSDTIDDADVLRKYPDAASEALGANRRFSNAAFRYAADAESYAMLVVKEQHDDQKVRGNDGGRVLMHSKQDCTALVSIQVTTPAKQVLRSYFTQKVKLPKEDYVTALYEFKLDKTGVTTADVSAATKTWLADQLEHAEKAP